eukprot:SAG25_NODE_101_length_15508_cov_11.653384_15_plen_122_part_00
MAAGSAAMRGQVRAASWHKGGGGGAASEAWRGAHRPTYGAALPWRCPRAECRLAETGAVNGAGSGRLVPLDETDPPSRSRAINYPSYRVAARGAAPLACCQAVTRGCACVACCIRQTLPTQ